MTAKEALLERVSHMSETEAEEALGTLPPGSDVKAGEFRDFPPAERQWGGDVHPLFRMIREIFADVPPEELAQLPGPDEIDRVAYRTRPG